MRDIDNTVLSSRVRLARNVAGLPFPHKLESEAAFGFMKKVSDLLKNTDRFSLYLMSRLDDLRKKALVERHLISPDLTKNSRCGAVMINADESVAVMLNEEDHIREQSIVKGFDISGAYERVRRVDDRIISGVSLAYDDALGFLTSCPTNVGTGMRASVMMFLPALTRSGKMPSLVKALTAKKMTVRGIYGEGSENSGYLYQISNKISLGYGEEEILRSVNAAAVRLCEFEAEERQALYQGNKIALTDRIMRAKGILQNAYVLPLGEFFERFADVKTGVALGLIKCRDVGRLNSFLTDVLPANLTSKRGAAMTETEREIFRAEYTAKNLAEILN